MRWLLLMCLPTMAVAESVVSTRIIRAGDVIIAADLKLVDSSAPGAVKSLDEVIGMEARVILYPGRPIQPQQLGKPAVVDRNQTVALIYSRGGLQIATEGKSLGRAGVGEILRVINSTSRMTVSGLVAPDGTVHVGTAGY